MIPVVKEGGRVIPVVTEGETVIPVVKDERRRDGDTSS